MIVPDWCSSSCQPWNTSRSGFADEPGVGVRAASVPTSFTSPTATPALSCALTLSGQLDNESNDGGQRPDNDHERRQHRRVVDAQEVADKHSDRRREAGA